MSVNLVLHIEFRSGADAETTINDVLCSFIKEKDIALVFINYYYAFLEIIEELFIASAHYLSLNKVKAHFWYDDMGKEGSQAQPEYV